MDDILYHFNPFHDELGRFRSMGRVSVIKPKASNKVVNTNIIDAEFTEKKVSSLSSKSKMSGKKKALIALGIIGGAAAIAGGVYAYKKHKEKKGARNMNNNIGHSSVFIERVNDKDSDSLSHFGIKGQKWGIRRFQNPDGSLTKKGEKEYKKESKILGANKGAIAGMAIGGAVGTGIVAKSYLRTVKRGANAGKIVSSGKKASPVSDGLKIISVMVGLGFLGRKVGSLIGKSKGEKELAEYGQQYITQKVSPKENNTKKVVKKSSSSKKKTTSKDKK